jgi:phosphoenolpyruvate---glycerone phosphotransferase subunit DhaL
VKIVAVDLRRALQRWCTKMTASASELNALDGRLGDGDLGVTLERCATLLQAALPATPDDISELLKSAAKACMEASGSSFGTLLAVGLLSAAKETRGRDVLERSDVSALLKASANAISQRGGARPGDKTFLDAMLAAHDALNQPLADDFKTTVLSAVGSAINQFRQRPNKVGRARMFGDQSIGIDDAGMIAFMRMVEAI